jgi:hypothetical protein
MKHSANSADEYKCIEGFCCCKVESHRTTVLALPDLYMRLKTDEEAEQMSKVISLDR